MAKKKKKAKRNLDDGQMDLFGPSDTELKRMLDKVDIALMTPLDALNFLNELKQKALEA